MTGADYAELGIPDPSALTGNQFMGYRIEQPAPLPQRDMYPDEREYKIALAHWFGVKRCDECGDETGECACDDN